MPSFLFLKTHGPGVSGCKAAIEKIEPRIQLAEATGQYRNVTRGAEPQI
jgi:hypothetical protein